MGIIINVDFSGNRNASYITTKRAPDNRVQLADGLIAPANEAVELEVAAEHKSEPIKSLDDINRISEYLIEHGRYRDNMLFIVGINFGLRISDLRTLQFAHLINDDFTFKTTFPILEKKTKNTRKVKQNRYITINEAVINAVTLYLEHNQCKLDDYLFRSGSNNGSNKNKPMTRQAIDLMLRKLAKEVGLDVHIATHSLRKTFGFHQMAMSGNDPRKLLLLQKIYGHSTSAQTLDYIGITPDEIEDAYLSLNLGGKNPYQAVSVLQESNMVV